MSDPTPDVMQIAAQYRKQLQSELAQLDTFIAEADRLARLTGDLPAQTDAGLLLPDLLRGDATLH